MDEPLIKAIFDIRNKIKKLESDIARAPFKCEYDLGRLQGKLDGYDESLNCLERILKDIANDDDN